MDKKVIKHESHQALLSFESQEDLQMAIYDIEQKYNCDVHIYAGYDYSSFIDDGK